ncbi:MAG TPA: class I adenylate-forming enzyme family protein [Candidatus Binatia bacterium]|jgi:long-chain acyl-CoA synthetase
MLFRLLTKQAKIYGEKTAVVGELRNLTFRQLLDEASSTAAYFQAQGHKVGDPIIIGVPPSPEFYIAFYAAAALGLVILPVLPSGRIPRLIIDREPKIAVGDQSFLAQAQRHCRTLRHLVPWSRATGLEVPRRGARFKRTKFFRDERIIGVSSSGTTGAPSIYYRSQELLVRRAELRANSLGIRPDDVLLSARPFNSGSSINSHVVMPLVAGCKIVVHEQVKRFQAADAITRERVTVLYGVPFVFELLASIPPDYPADFSSLRLCISGSAPLAESVANAFHRRFGVEIRQRYGGSHIHPAFTYNIKGVRGAVGQNSGPFPITVLDEKGREPTPGTIGELAFDCNRVARTWKKYLKDNPNRRGRYIYTGDLGRMDDAGNVFVVGRKSPFIKVRGNRVEPAEVEAVLRSHPEVQEAFVYPIARGKPDEAVGALVVAKATKVIELLRYCAEHLDGYKCPRKIAIRSALPRTAHGKLARSILDKETADG